MKRLIIVLLAAAVMVPHACGECVNVNCSKHLLKDTTLCKGEYKIEYDREFALVTIGADNITLDCSGSTLIGGGQVYGIYNNDYDNVTIKNCIVKNYSIGIYLESNSSNNKIINNTVYSNSHAGISLESSPSNYIRDNLIYNNSFFGLILVRSDNNTIQFNEVYNHTNLWNSRGIGVFTSSDNNRILSNVVYNNRIDNIELWNNSHYNEIVNNTAYGSEYGILISNNTNSNKIKENNIYGNDYGIGIGHENETWGGGVFNNTIKGNKIRGNGIGIRVINGSNNRIINNEILSSAVGIYSQNSNTTFNSNFVCSSTVIDFNSTGWLSSSGENNTCDLPGTWNDKNSEGCSTNCSVCRCSSCPECIYKLNFTNPLCSYVYLTEAVSQSTTCIDSPENFNGKVFDCGGNTIEGSGDYSFYGIHLIGKSQNTIKNCTIKNWYGGIYLESSSGNFIVNNNASSNVDSGIYLDSCSNNTIKNNKVNSNGNAGLFLGYCSNHTIINNKLNLNLIGISLESSSGNLMINNTASSNADSGIYLPRDCSNNTLKENKISKNNYGIHSEESVSNITSNFVCYNNEYDFFSDDNFSSSYGHNNTCTLASGWNDNGTEGCAITCPCDKGDFNCDKEIDLEDFVKECIAYTGAYPASAPNSRGDFDNDIDIDLVDFIKFFVAYKGTI